MPSARVRTQLFWRDDIESVLRAIDRSNEQLTSALPLAEVAIYRAGFQAALQAVATSFDLHLDTPSAPATQAAAVLLLKAQGVKA
jgi:hypothetical protein